MLGRSERSGLLFSHVDLEERVPQNHPLRAIRAIANTAPEGLSSEFAALLRAAGPPGDPTGEAVAVVLLDPLRAPTDGAPQVQPLVPLVVGFGVDDAAGDHSTFSKNHDRLLAGEVSVKFPCAILAQARVGQLFSSEHFSVDGTMVEVWASMKSFRPKGDGGGRNAEAGFRGETHVSTTDPDAKLYCKGPGMGAKLCFLRSCADGKSQRPRPRGATTRMACDAARLAALDMIATHANRPKALTLGADRAYETAHFVSTPISAGTPC
jgi:hypothetical protein